eukprot:scaffold178549_cov30-Tisochrysis_lutea.AAC.1
MLLLSRARGLPSSDHLGSGNEREKANEETRKVIDQEKSAYRRLAEWWGAASCSRVRRRRWPGAAE